MTPRDVLNLVERLQEAELVKVHWGGSVSLTPTGKQHAEGRKAGASVPGSVTISDIGPGAHVVFNSPEAVVGYQATGHGSIGAGATVGTGAIRIEAPLGDLAAALQGLRTARTTLDESDQEPTRALEEEVAATVREVQQSSPDRVGLERRLERVRRSGGALVRSDRSSRQTPAGTGHHRYRSRCDRQVARTALAGMTPARCAAGAGSWRFIIRSP